MTAAPIIVTATLGGEDFAWLDALRRAHYPPDRNQLPAHLTLFHHLPPSIAPELSRRLTQLSGGPPPAATVDRVLMLGRGVAFGIISPGLEGLRSELAEAFATLLVPQDAGRWRPHVTVQNKAEPRQAKALHAALREGFAPRPLAVRGIASFYYRGGPWEQIGDYRFRGR